MNTEYKLIAVVGNHARIIKDSNGILIPQVNNGNNEFCNIEYFKFDNSLRVAIQGLIDCCGIDEDEIEMIGE